MKQVYKITVALLMVKKVKSNETEEGFEFHINRWNPLVFVVAVVTALISFLIEGFRAGCGVFQLIYKKQ